MLVLLTVASGGMLLFTSLKPKSGNQLNPNQATLLINREDAQVVDVRDPAAYNNGHLQGARNIPVAKIAESAAQIEKLKGKPLIVCCDTGIRSGKAAAEFEKLGVERVYNLDGGVQAWASAGLPLTGKGRK